MSMVKEEIRKQIDSILSSENEKELYALNDMLLAWYEHKKGWGNTSLKEKQEILQAFDNMENPANRISHDDMKLHLSSWRERLNGQR